MRVRRRQAIPTPPGDPPEVAVVAAPVEAVPRRRGRGIVLAALALAVLIVLVALALGRARRGADVLGLGDAPSPPISDEAGAAAGGELQEPPLFGPGESVSGDAVPADPGAPGTPAVADPAAPGAAPGPAPGAPAGPAAGGGAPGGGGAAVIPVLTTRGTTPGPGASTTVGAGSPPPPPPPPCTLSQTAADPNPVELQGGSRRLSSDVTVTFSPLNCGGAAFQVAVNGVVLNAAPTTGGTFSATIDRAAGTWDAGSYPVTITGGGTSVTFVLKVTSAQPR